MCLFPVVKNRIASFCIIVAFVFSLFCAQDNQYQAPGKRTQHSWPTAPFMLGVVASVCTSLKVFPVSNIGQQYPTTRNNMQQGMDLTCNIQRCRGLFARGFRCLHRVTSHSSADFLSYSESPSFHVNNRREAKLMTLAWLVVWKYSC